MTLLKIGLFLCVSLLYCASSQAQHNDVKSCILEHAHKNYPHQDIDLVFDYPPSLNTTTAPNLLDYHEEQGRFRATLSGVNKPITGRVRIMISLPVLNKPVSAQHTIQSDDITSIRIDSSTLKDDHAVRATDLVGKQPRHKTLSVMQPISMRDVMAPRIVKHDQVMRVVYQDGTLKMSTLAKARKDASVGDSIAFSLLNGRKKHIEATVVDADTAYIRVMAHT